MLFIKKYTDEIAKKGALSCCFSSLTDDEMVFKLITNNPQAGRVGLQWEEIFPSGERVSHYVAECEIHSFAARCVCPISHRL